MAASLFHFQVVITVIILPQHAPLFGPSSLSFLFRGRLAGQSTTTTFCDLLLSGVDGGVPEWCCPSSVVVGLGWMMLDVGCRVSGVGCLVLWHLDGVRDLREID